MTIGKADDARRLFRPILVVTAFNIAGQGINFITQIAIANLFGSRPDMDALIAANTLPDYLIAVILGSLGVVFIPVFIDYVSDGKEKDAWIITSGIINLCLLVLGVLVVIGMLFARPILQLTVPGLAPQTLDIASQIAMIIWPSILVTSIFSFLAGIYQAQGQFGMPALASFAGQAINLILVLLLTQPLGILGVAIAATANVIIQVALVLHIGFGPGRYQLKLGWKHPGVREVISLLLPLIPLGIVTRWTPIIDRYLISNLPSGSISHLNYALKIVEVIATFLSAGISIVIFPRMALKVSEKDITGLRNTISMSLRIMWLAVAPAISIGIAIALPAVTVLFQRGQFSREDAEAVASLMRVYLFALIGMSLGTITGRSLYALRDTRIVAQIGVTQSLIYVVYVSSLVNRLGLVGAAVGYVIYFNLSLLWQLFLIRQRTGRVGGSSVVQSFAKTSIAAATAGIVAYVTLTLFTNLYIQLILSSAIGIVTYLIILMMMHSSELTWIFATLRGSYSLSNQ